MGKRHYINQTDRIYIYNRAKGHCQICGSCISFDDMTVDHIYPVSLGGNNCLQNYQCTCKSCNQMKRDYKQNDFYEKITEIFWYQTQQKCGTDFSEKLSALIIKNS